MPRPALRLTTLPDGTARLDCLGDLCPIPIIRAGQAMRKLGKGSTLEILADDPGVESDFKDYCIANRHELVGMQASDGVWTTRIRKGW